jgi:hypothetical protein
LIWFTLACVIAFACALRGRGQGYFAKDLLLPAYVNSVPAAVLRVPELRTEYERRGFFTIGALPCVVLDKAQIVFFTNGCSTEALSKLNRAIASKAAGRRVRFTDVSLVASNEACSAVTAKSMSVDALGNWHFKNGEVALGDHRSRFQTAMLSCSSSNAGAFIITDFSSSKFQLLTHTPQ